MLLRTNAHRKANRPRGDHRWILKVKSGTNNVEKLKAESHVVLTKRLTQGNLRNYKISCPKASPQVIKNMRYSPISCFLLGDRRLQHSP
ncbi:hypothetical protein FQA47_005236 [Oryzias melastigma]|uniref:Uncharacterized protein n=1 Tax=Oryzias melastigma TaxID=30732 RepID=A0A834F8C1_ORYME|nr:hypothetical protein FQA47_005236 [Oryzias melastigma]